MRIGIDIRAIGSQRTGDETYTLQLVKNLMLQDKENKYFLYTDTNDYKKLQKINKLLNITSSNFVVVSIVPSSKALWTLFFLPRQVRRDSLDVLHVQYITPLFLSKKTKLVTTIHDISFARYPQLISKKDLIILKMLIFLSLKRADKIIAVSRFTKYEIMDVYKISSNKIHVIYNGGVTMDFQKIISKEQVLSLRKRYGIMKPYLLYLGTLQPRKNIPFLIKVFVALKVKYKGKKEVDELELVLRGNRNGHNYDQAIDSQLATVRRRHKKIYTQIKFLDYIPNEQVPALFKGAKIFCFTSFYEGFGLPVLEAMASGTPVIANDRSCLPEIIQEAGLVCGLDNYDEWVDDIFTLLIDGQVRRNIIEKGYKRIGDFSWEQNARQTITLYKNMTKDSQKTKIIN